MSTINRINDFCNKIPTKKKKIIIDSESGKYNLTVHDVPFEALLKYKMGRLR